MNIDREAVEKIQNDLEVIKTRVSSLDRIAVMGNKQVIVDDLKDIIGNRRMLAAVLYLTKKEVSRSDLAKELGTDTTNVNKFTNPFLGNKGYLNEFKRAGRVFYRRDEKIDLIGFERIEPFKSLVETWRRQKSDV